MLSLELRSDRNTELVIFSAAQPVRPLPSYSAPMTPLSVSASALAARKRPFCDVQPRQHTSAVYYPMAIPILLPVSAFGL